MCRFRNDPGALPVVAAPNRKRRPPRLRRIERHRPAAPGSIPPDLAAALAGQRAAVAASGTDDLAALDAALGVLPGLLVDLGLGTFLGALADFKPRLVLRFRRDPAGRPTGVGDDVVLKVYGDRPRGEGPLLQLWHGLGVPTPRVRSGERGGCSWLLLEHLPLRPVRVPDRASRLALTREVAAHGTVMHRPAPRLDAVLRPLPAVMVPRWTSAVAVLAAAGHEVAPHQRAAVLPAYGAGPSRPLHGDLGLPNLARGPGGRLVLYDASALAGPAAFDAARWSARLAGDDLGPEELLHVWSEHEPLEHGCMATRLLGAECLLEAGSRLVVAAQDPDAAPPPAIDVLLDAAARLLT
ncbi:hypothetical protein [Blastococcus saxobsidens]|uniref:Aminoglycoside phosphotransferase domain-containing protein n=1 Tax=Blastococcus saxobsidens TaxID=138336 RepID=A0A4Q7YCB1_9ACTN|nr:hypothetical protein [Blastococcus saxobsidens]RZU34143.1 hypothetical protein BKA19_3900 [Blastococcus saxobsidens]